jgi:hypothetical protein
LRTTGDKEELMADELQDQADLSAALEAAIANLPQAKVGMLSDGVF